MPDRAYLFGNIRHKPLPSKARLYRHDQHHFYLRKHIHQNQFRGSGRNCNARFQPKTMDQIYALLYILLCLHMHGNDIRASLGKGRNEPNGIFHHQVYIQRQISMRAKSCYHIRAKRNIRHKMPIHDIYVDPVRTSLL